MEVDLNPVEEHRMIGRIVLGAFAAVTVGAPGHAQTISYLKLAGPDAFRETFLGQVPGPSPNRNALVGVVLVGIHNGPEQSTFDPARLEVLLPQKVTGRFLCLSVISRDGRYSAQSRYLLGDAPSGRSNLEFNTKFAKELRQYVGADIAVRAFSADSCSNPGKVDNLVVSYSGKDEFIVLKIRGGDARIRAQLGRAGKALSSPILCEQAQGVRVGFTNLCYLPIGDSVRSGSYQVSIGETGSNGSVSVKTYPLNIVVVK